MRSLVQGRRDGRRAGLAVWCTTVLLALTAMVLAVAPASAHTELVSSSPEDGANVTRLPVTVELTFSESVGSRGVFVVVTDPVGDQVEAGQPEVTDDTVRQATKGRGPAGDYTLAYRVVSSDGHPVSGELSFTVEEGTAPETSGEPQGSAEPSAEPRTPEQATGTASGGSQSDEGFVSRHVGQLGLAAAGLAAVAVLVGVGVRGRHVQD